jgi:AP-1 complex subunit gamma-1
LYATILTDTSQITLVHVAIWCIGEYGDLLIRPCNETGVDYPPIGESDIVTLLDSCLRLHNADITTKSYVLNALIKLTTRASPAIRGRILSIMNSYRGSMILELQQRGAEYSTLLSGQWEGLRGELLGKMPILDEATLKKKRGITDDLSSPTEILSPQVNHAPQQSFQNTAPVAAAKPAGGSFLLDLDDIFGGGGSNNAPLQPSPSTNQPVYGNPSPQPAFQTNDLLADIFAPAPAAPVVSQMSSNVFASQPAPLAFSPPAPPANPTFKAFEKSGLSVMFELSKPNPSNPASTTILCKFANQTSSPISNLVFQVSLYHFIPILNDCPRLLFQNS